MLDCKLAVYLGLVSLIPSLQGHGYLKVPPGRSTLWTEFESGSRPAQIKVNNDHNGLNCGGFIHQWEIHDGACGICGDPVDGVRENEAGGKYASGYISRSYQQGQVIDVAVRITADHKGWFEFRLCPHNNPTVPATQACLDQYLLEQEDGSTRYTWTDFNPALHELKLKLPDDVTCSQCIIQWKYHAGNSWGCDFAVSTSCAIGYGPQEEFYGCSDVSIIAAGTTTTEGSTETDTASTSQSSESTTTSAPESTTSTTESTAESTSVSTSQPESSTSSSTSLASQSTLKATTAVKKATTNAVQVCVAVSPYDNTPGMDNWCRNNCALDNCPETHCKCSSPVTSTKSSTLTTLLMSTTSTLSQAITTASETCSFYKSTEILGLTANLYCNMCSRDDSCPPGQCTCDTSLPVLTCTGRGTFNGVVNFEAFCQYICTYSPSTCPQDKCACT